MAAEEAATGCERERSKAEEVSILAFRELSEARFQKPKSISAVAEATVELGLGFGGLI